MQYTKPKPAIKDVLSRGESLKKIILDTMNTCSTVVGSTLGPGGMSVVIERQEENLPPLITKDGVTVFRNLGFSDGASQLLMEAARDASVRTAAEAGDGTTSATVLSEALVRKTMEYCENNRKTSPQRVVRILDKTYKKIVEPWIERNSLQSTLETEDGRNKLLAVAKVSANGDTALSDAVLKCFDLTGDEGNVTILEVGGQGDYSVERIEGYTVFKGYEDSCGKYYQKFLNDQARQLVSLDKPSYILYHGKLVDIFSVLPLFDKISKAVEEGTLSPNVVLVTTGFSENVLAHLAMNFAHPGTINVYPIAVPITTSNTGQYDTLADIAALSAGRIFDQINAPLENASVEDLGKTSAFEASRFRSNIIGWNEELLVFERVDQLKEQLKGDISKLDKIEIEERIGKISGGIAKLKILGNSAGELREKRDRAEDAVCAVRGALKHGALPAGGWSFIKLGEFLKNSTYDSELEKDVVVKILVEALKCPVELLFTNAGYNLDEVSEIVPKIVRGEYDIFDVMEGKMANAINAGLLDSTPAVREAIKNSLSIATLLGTCGGAISFRRDIEVDRWEARDTADFLRNANINEADERA